MEKINALIDKLQELKNSGAELSAISYYAQLLQAEVLHARNKLHQQQVQSTQGNIAVIMPAQQPVAVTMPAAAAPQTTTLPSNKPAEAPVASPEPEEVNARAAKQNDVPTRNTVIISEDINTRAAKAEAPSTNEQAATPTASPAEIPPAADLVPPKPEPVVTAQPLPTLVVNQPAAEKPRSTPAATLFDDIPPAKDTASSGNGELRKDLNELVGSTGTSLNDRLRQQQVEVAQKLGEMPINDLRQAIGINDKYQFIQELFRGDRDLYERSIKTINEFGNLREADYWIQREIKIIQGWEDDNHLVQHFYSLLRKRFS
ncbi:hypothetical protein [Chitinophaga polysaccharea]|uniref:hypothetical protein n=1 Tax=Chitinophaga polysaccharea TaxID=1293035 RepID=UPI001158F765|nr:hypothetical protein [Chitinophaga polysaccharea]